MAGKPALTTSSGEFERITLPVGEGEPGRPVKLGHFEIGPQLGSGGSSVVYEARDTVVGRKVAIKLGRPGRGGESRRTLLLREAQALAQLKHPNVVTLFEAGTTGDEVFLAMELVEGATLRQWMEQPHGWREVLDVFLGFGRGLAAAHAMGLVHRDVKPGNVFLERDGTAKIGDFGLASSPRESETGTAVEGTPGYMSPEQALGAAADARADQFAYCVSLHQALTGLLPGAQGQPRPVPRAVRRILERGLDRRPEARYPSMDALLADLARARRGRTRVWLALAGAAAMAGVAAAGWAVARANDPCPAPSAKIEPVWGTDRRTQVRARMLAVDPAQGAARFAAVATYLDPVVDRFRRVHVEACRATRVSGSQSDTMLDLRMRCLDRRFAELEESVALLAAAGGSSGLDRAVAGAVQITPLEGCSDLAALTAAAPLPEQP